MTIVRAFLVITAILSAAARSAMPWADGDAVQPA